MIHNILFILCTLFVSQSVGATSTPWWDEPQYQDQAVRLNKAKELLNILETKIRTPNSAYPYFMTILNQNASHKKLILDFFGIDEATDEASSKIFKQRYLKICKWAHPDRDGLADIFKRIKQLYEEINDSNNTYRSGSFEQQFSGQPHQSANDFFRSSNGHQNFHRGFYSQRGRSRTPEEIHHDAMMGFGVLVVSGTLVCSFVIISILLERLNAFRSEFSRNSSRERLCRIENSWGNQTQIYKKSSIRPLVNFNLKEKNIISDELSRTAWFSPQWLRILTGHTEDGCKRFSLYPRYAHAIVGIGVIHKRKGWNHVYKQDSIRHNCKKLSKTLFEKVQSIVNDEFMPKVETAGRNKKLSFDAMLTHKVEAATIIAETARELFPANKLKLERKQCENMAQIEQIEKNLLEQFRSLLTEKLHLLMT